MLIAVKLSKIYYLKYSHNNNSSYNRKNLNNSYDKY